MSRALVVIDVQNEYFQGRLPIYNTETSLPNILKAMDHARARGIPIAVIQHTNLLKDAVTFRKGSPEWELHPEVAKRPHDVLIEKNMPGSFTGTELENWLRNKGVDTVVIAGYMAHLCCDTTSRQAVHLGFSVEFLADATGTIPLKTDWGELSAEELHRNVLIIQAARFSKVLRTADWVEQAVSVQH